MKLIADLEALGYVFELQDGQVHYTHAGRAPDPAAVRPLLEELRQRKAEALEYLRQPRADPPVCQRSAAEEEAWWARVLA